MRIHLAALLGLVALAPVAPRASADVEARTWADAEEWEADLLDDPFVPRHRIVWETLPVPDGVDVDGMWFPYGYFAGIEFRKTEGPPGIIYRYDGQAWLDPVTSGGPDDVTFVFGEWGGGGTWYEPVSSIGVRVVSDTLLLATAFDVDEQVLGTWPVLADPSEIWGLVADDYIIGSLVITDYGSSSDWQLRFPIVIGARVPEPTTAVLLPLLMLALRRRGGHRDRAGGKTGLAPSAAG